ncbi:hypothetical protein V6N11_080940 [Hibiscus sabdariffa]|uniref:Uncharacterized protein n=1 Tax=Hibiscus sabdariffa TaxID=183260 RepID=A0ABR2QIR5_9ROSI
MIRRHRERRHSEIVLAIFYGIEIESEPMETGLFELKTVGGFLREHLGRQKQRRREIHIGSSHLSIILGVEKLRGFLIGFEQPSIGELRRIVGAAVDEDVVRGIERARGSSNDGGGATKEGGEEHDNQEDSHWKWEKGRRKKTGMKMWH